MGVRGADGYHQRVVARCGYASVLFKTIDRLAEVASGCYDGNACGDCSAHCTTQWICPVGFCRRRPETKVHHFDVSRHAVFDHPIDSRYYIAGLADAPGVEHSDVN